MAFSSKCRCTPFLHGPEIRFNLCTCDLIWFVPKPVRLQQVYDLHISLGKYIFCKGSVTIGSDEINVSQTKMFTKLHALEQNAKWDTKFHSKYFYDTTKFWLKIPYNVWHFPTPPIPQWFIKILIWNKTVGWDENGDNTCMCAHTHTHSNNYCWA